MRRVLTAFALAALAGCATVDPYAVDPVAAHLQRDDAIGYCARLFADIDRRVDTLGVRDVEAQRIAGFPYLRVDRFDSALAERADDAPRRQAWLRRLAELDDEARSAELANAALPSDDLDRCRALLLAEDASRYADLRARARVPDDYSTGMRVLGLYALTRFAFAEGIDRWHAQTRADFAGPVGQLPVRGRLVRFALPGEAPPLALPVPADALGIQRLSRFDRMALLQRNAPVLEIDVAGAFDRPGTMQLDRDGVPTVDPAMPAASTRIAHAIIGGQPVVQLVYTFLFAERPSRGAFDLLAGRVDGLIWRVTLARDGSPLVYDTIHPCGCYHLFFPTEQVVARPPLGDLDEGLFAPQAVAVPRPGETIVLRIESGTHYLQRVTVEKRGGAAMRYGLDDERHLASLPLAGGGTRSAYGRDGLVEGSERGERFFLWPTGVLSPGQMRQWGHHATAFVGRRHFDDPMLLDSYFTLRGAGTAARTVP
jgi:hypothetical protein